MKIPQGLQIGFNKSYLVDESPRAMFSHIPPPFQNKQRPLSPQESSDWKLEQKPRLATFLTILQPPSFSVLQTDPYRLEKSVSNTRALHLLIARVLNPDSPEEGPSSQPHQPLEATPQQTRAPALQ
ncbi:hypothetical protein AVEN_188895-1 [Araneus ventricosus]|uniref:Uncharacterized protein n=1 Tax=Araneus ventricosus TaxID=182803 RepID=A0A4Y2P3D3_ARAVE|nr:hypothetical protein AVEN_188895-1 [Araneus ventricosus]